MGREITVKAVISCRQADCEALFPVADQMTQCTGRTYYVIFDHGFHIVTMDDVTESSLMLYTGKFEQMEDEVRKKAVDEWYSARDLLNMEMGGPQIVGGPMLDTMHLTAVKNIRAYANGLLVADQAIREMSQAK